VQHAVTSREDWLSARNRLLASEKAMTRARDALSDEQRALPWVRIDKEYLFTGPDGPISLPDLFQGRNQLFTKNFMLSPGQKHQCVGCSLEVDHVEGLLEHLAGNGVSYAVVAPAPIEEIETMRKKMDWRFTWVSSYGNDYMRDVVDGFAPTGTGGSGNNVFYRDENGQIFHTYASYGRGGEDFLGIYRILDLMPKGRNETGPYQTLADWAKPRTMYHEAGVVARNGEYHPTENDCSCSSASQ
jgi:predicted dithiol-disulfide oxidoreductase (DUF899 family)